MPGEFPKEVALTPADRGRLLTLFRKRDKANRAATEAIVDLCEELVEKYNPPFYPVHFDETRGVMLPAPPPEKKLPLQIEKAATR